MLRWVCVVLAALAAYGQETVGVRPYEMDWAGRTQDEVTPFVDFETLDGWRAVGTESEATFSRTREAQLFGSYVGKLVYRGTGTRPSVMVQPPQPIPVPGPFDTVRLWVDGNAIYRPTPANPQCDVRVHLAGPKGDDVAVTMTHVNYHYWYLAYRKLTPEQQATLAGGAKFTGIEVANGRNPKDLTLHFDNLAFVQEQLKPLTFAPRPKRGIDMFPGQGVGTNTGPGKLPFPTRAETILPANLTAGFRTALAAEGAGFVFTYQGADGTLRYRLTPQTGTWSDVSAEWQGRGGVFQPVVGGGVYLADAQGQPVAPEKAEPLEARRDGDTVVTRVRLTAGGQTVEAAYTWRLWQKSLVVDTKVLGGQVAEVRYGRAVGLTNPRLVQVPYYVYTPGRPMVTVAGPVETPLFISGNTDWYLSNASVLFGDADVAAAGAAYNGGARYVAKTDGKRNDCYERFFITVSPRFEEVLPTVPNPVSPYKDVTGTRVWRAYGAGNREKDAEYWRRAHRYGLTELVVTDHETMWRDSDESFTFRTRTAPGKGGDEGQVKTTRIMRDELGYVYGPYNNFTDFATVNEFWSPDMVARTPDGQLATAWFRCYAPKPAYAVEYCAKLSPINQQKFNFNTAYCDVHTAVAPWSRTDYDARVPGAGTFAATLYSYGEIMLLQKQAWGGPVYSEGNHHCFLHGLTDGNYAQDQDARLPENPWLVDFDLLKLHDLGCNFGMGNPGMFYGERRSPGSSQAERDAYLDRFLAATIAFGHPGFLVFEGGTGNALRSYYMVQQLASAYTRTPVAAIRYADAAGKLLDTSAAVAAGATARDQVVNRYANGTVTVVNGNPTERLKLTVDGRALDLPPTGYAGWSADHAVEVFSGDAAGHRIDYAATPAYTYFDGRGTFARLPKAAGAHQAVCRKLAGGKFEVIPYGPLDAGFDLGVAAATATALDEDGKVLGPAEVRVSRGLVYVMPVDQAFSYVVTPATAAAGLSSDRDEVVAGETVTVRGQQPHTFLVPADAQAGQRLWQQFEGRWIDFVVRPAADTTVTLAGNTLNVQLTSHLPAACDGTITAVGQQKTVHLVPGQPVAASFDLGPVAGESLRDAAVELKAGGTTLTEPWVLRTTVQRVTVAATPQRFSKGMALRKQPETMAAAALSAAHAAVNADSEASCGNVPKQAAPGRLLLGMHPPYTGGVGYSFALLDPVTLPKEPAAAFRANVGKKDGSDPGDGILYRFAVVTEDGKETQVAETQVTKHEWVPLEADLSRWAGQTIRMKLIADVGPGDNSSGDWAAIADLRFESLKEVPVRTLQPPGGRYGSVAGPHPTAGLTLADLRRAKAGRVHYEAANLAGHGQYASYGVLNGVKLGEMSPAGGQPEKGIFAPATIDLTPAAIASLGVRNVFTFQNPNGNSIKIRRLWLELDLPDGRKASSRVSTATFTQPPEWPYFEGIGLPFGEDLQVELWFDVAG